MTAPPATTYRIVGSGPVALACALFMVRAGIDPRRVQVRLPLVAAKPAPAESQPGSSLRRMLALSEGSRQLLCRVVAMPAGGVIERIEVALSGRSGRTRIQASDFGLAALGHVIAYPELVVVLRVAVERMPFVAGGPWAASTAPTAQEVTIHADGIPQPSGRTPVAFGPPGFRSREFNQAALLTEVVAGYGGTTAYECFTEHGPLALLPAAPEHSPRYAVVWCDRPHAIAARSALSPAELSAALNEALVTFGPARKALGTLQVCAPVQTAQLSRLQRVHGASGREVWIGNAAQALHPVAGQGLNLGLRDAFELARRLADNEYSKQPLAPEQMLAQFAAGRRIDRSITTGVTDLLAAAFTWPLARPLQSALLTAMDLLPPVRRPLAETLLYGQR